MRRLLISFSGGETSAYMTWMILVFLRHLYDEIIIVFANTGQENEQALEFVDWCDRELFAPLGYRVVYVEAVQNFGERKSAGFRIVDFETADRDGRPFEDYIRKYGIPNSDYPGCTRDLKLNAIKAYCRSVGWENGSYDTAVGIRADEIDRQSLNARKNRVIYPLIKRGITKPQINEWWSKRPRRLALKGYQGNCKWCWKKSFRKHLTIIGETPEAYEFPRRMEALYGRVGPEFSKAETDPHHRRRFFRGRRSTDDLFAMFEVRGDNFVPAEDDAVILPEQRGFFDADLDTPGGCGESCEVWTDDLDAAA